MGNSEASDNYRTELENVFNETVAGLYRNEINLIQGHEKLKELRSRYNIGYTDEAGVVDSMLDRVAEGTMSPEETRYYFAMLQENTLSEHRTLSYQKRFAAHQKELLALIQLQIDGPSSGEVSVSELRNTMNNYYDFFGLRFGDEYRSLNNLITMFADGRLSIDGLKAQLAVLSAAASEAASIEGSTGTESENGGGEYDSGTYSASSAGQPSGNGSSESSPAAETSGGTNAQSSGGASQGSASAGTGGQGTPKR